MPPAKPHIPTALPGWRSPGVGFEQPFAMLHRVARGAPSNAVSRKAAWRQSRPHWLEGDSAASRRLTLILWPVLLLDVLFDDLQRRTAARQYAVAARPKNRLAVVAR